MDAYAKLEIDWATTLGLNPAGMVACSSGTAALHLALEACNIVPDREVVVGDFNMIAIPRAVSLSRLKPVFVDCRRNDLNIDTDMAASYARRTGSNTVRAVILTSIYGRRADVDGWAKHADERIVIIEDLAEAHGVAPHPKTAVACWSFYKNKIVAGEEGGSVWFRDPEKAALARRLRCLGFNEAHDFIHTPRGHNYRMSNAHAELILPSIANLHYNTHARSGRLHRCDTLCPREWRQPPRIAPWVYDIRIPGLGWDTQTTIVKKLNDEGIRARQGFKPMHSQPEYCRNRVIGGNESSLASREVFYLPLSDDMIPARIQKAFEVIEKCL